MAESLSQLETAPDPYERLLVHGARAKEQRAARQHWWKNVSAPNKRGALFELEALLKASACFANPRNHPGRTSRAAITVRDFHASLELFDHVCVRIGELCSQLLGEHHQRVVFQRYLETSLSDDLLRARVSAAPEQSTPELELARLRRSFTHVHEIIQTSLRAPRINYRLFYSLLSLARQEVEHSRFFDPLRALEFRPETDAIEAPQIVAGLERMPAGPAQRLAALTLLTLFRLNHSIALLKQIVAHDLPTMPGCIFGVLSVFRSEARALCRYLLSSSALLLKSDFSARIHDVSGASTDLHRLGHELIDLRRYLESQAWSLRLEVRLVFDLFLSSPDDAQSVPAARGAVKQIEARLSPFLHNQIAVLASALPGTSNEATSAGWPVELSWVTNGEHERQQSSLRLRRDCWVFCCVAEAFVSALPTSSLNDVWASQSAAQFAHEFLNYFRALGLPLARLTRYQDLTALVDALVELQLREPWGAGLVAKVGSECRKFSEHLRASFDQLNRSKELDDYPFDAASTALEVRAYLGQVAKPTV